MFSETKIEIVYILITQFEEEEESLMAILWMLNIVYLCICIRGSWQAFPRLLQQHKKGYRCCLVAKFGNIIDARKGSGLL